MDLARVGIELVLACVALVRLVLAWLVLNLYLLGWYWVGWRMMAKADLLPVPMHLSAHLVRSELKKPCNADCNHNSYRKIAFPKLIQMQYLFNMPGSIQVLIVKTRLLIVWSVSIFTKSTTAPPLFIQ